MPPNVTTDKGSHTRIQGSPFHICWGFSLCSGKSLSPTVLGHQHDGFETSSEWGSLGWGDSVGVRAKQSC